MSGEQMFYQANMKQTKYDDEYVSGDKILYSITYEDIYFYMESCEDLKEQEFNDEELEIIQNCINDYIGADIWNDSIHPALKEAMRIIKS